MRSLWPPLVLIAAMVLAIPVGLWQSEAAAISILALACTFAAIHLCPRSEGPQ